MKISIGQLRGFINETLTSQDDALQQRMRQRYSASIAARLFDEINDFGADSDRQEVFRDRAGDMFGRHLDPRDVDQIVAHMERISDGDMSTRRESCNMLADDIVSRMYAPDVPIYF
jgi:hypothetical protein